MKNMLITGGCGFIGSNFVDHVFSEYEDYNMLVLDNLTYAGNVTNLSRFKDDSRVMFSRVDLTDSTSVNQILQDVKIDVIVNFAAESHVDRSIEDASIFLKTNIIGTYNMLEIARKSTIERFVQVSTDEVYGSLASESPPFTETTPLHPNNPYSASKASADLLVQSYVQTHGFPAMITRCSNNYGPFQFPEKLIPVVITKALAREKIPVYGSGINVRDWIHVRDHCEGIMRVIDRGIDGEIYNFGGNSEIDNLSLVKMILDIMDLDEDLISFVKDRAGHDFRYAMDYSKARRELEWMPRISLDDGLKETVAWYLRNQDWIQAIQNGSYQQINDEWFSFFKHIIKTGAT